MDEGADESELELELELEPDEDDEEADEEDDEDEDDADEDEDEELEAELELSEEDDELDDDDKDRCLLLVAPSRVALETSTAPTFSIVASNEFCGEAVVGIATDPLATGSSAWRMGTVSLLGVFDFELFRSSTLGLVVFPLSSLVSISEIFLLFSFLINVFSLSFLLSPVDGTVVDELGYSPTLPSAPIFHPIGNAAQCIDIRPNVRNNIS